ncbi:carboxypeptidase regulatory-like domain-containing protein [Candidatus Acetothermia bacterium]|nr:carboxypeptidase regulatory-like domain-containing protein [Candidatus Acetothermia bacterium]
MITRAKLISLLAVCLIAFWGTSAWAKIKVEGDAAFQTQVQQCFDRYQKAGGEAAQILANLQDPKHEHLIKDYRAIRTKAEQQIENALNNQDNQNILDLIGIDKSKTDKWLNLIAKPEKNSTIPRRPRDAVPTSFQAFGERGTGRGSGTTITVDPGYGGELAPGVRADFCSTLIHEMTHAREMNDGVANPSPDPATHTKITEINATTVENRWRAANGLSQRPTYSGDKLPPTAFAFPIGQFEAERQRIEKLVNQSNNAYGELGKMLDQLIQEAKDKAAEIKAALDKIVATVPSSESVQNAVNKVKEEADTLVKLAQAVQDPADQVCKFAEYITNERNPKSRDEMVQAAKMHLKNAEEAFKKATDQVKTLKKASASAAKEANDIKDKIKQAIKDIKALVSKLEAELKAAATAAVKKVQQSLDDVTKPGEEAKQAATALAKLIDQTIALGAFNPAQIGQMQAVKSAVNTAVGTLKTFGATLKAGVAATQAQDIANELKQKVTDQSNDLDGKKDVPDNLLKEAGDEVTIAAVAAGQAEENLKHARTCLDKVLKPGTKTTLHGYIYDSKSDKPISGASVSASGNISASVSSGGAGTFTLTGVDLGTVVNINVSAKGYRGRFKSVKVVDEDPLVNFALEPGKSSGSAKLTGTVVDKETGKKIIGATVSVEGQTATAGAGGSFSIGGLPDDAVVTVKAEAKGYSASSRGVKLTKAETTPITIALWPEIKELNLTWVPADPAPKQSVIVTASILPRRAGVAVRMTVSGNDGYYNSQVLTTDANGQVSLFVPGGAKEITDTITAEVLGRPLKKTDKYVF